MQGLMPVLVQSFPMHAAYVSIYFPEGVKTHAIKGTDSVRRIYYRRVET